MSLTEAIHKAGLAAVAAQKQRLRKTVNGVSDADSVPAGGERRDGSIAAVGRFWCAWTAVFTRGALSIAAAIVPPIGVSIARPATCPFFV